MRLGPEGAGEMLVAVVLAVQPVEVCALPVSHGVFAYAGALDLLGRVSPALAADLHDRPGTKPLTVGPVAGRFLNAPGHRLLLPPGEVYRWRLTGLNRAVSEALLCLDPSLGGVRLGDAVFTIVDAATRPDAEPEAGRAGYEELLGRWQGQAAPQSVTLQFVTPTTFRAGRSEQPFPLPDLVWGSLLKRWNACAERPLEGVSELFESAVVLGNWKGETRRVELGRSRTVGFIGKFTYWVTGDAPDTCRTLSVLADFAFYAGVGWQTTQGMGQTRRIGQVGQVDPGGGGGNR